MQHKLKQTTTLGRSSNCDIQVPSTITKVSREHVQIQIHNNMYVLYDQSTLGTFVNDIPEKQIVLKNGDSINLGGAIEFRFFNGVLTSSMTGIQSSPASAPYLSPPPIIIVPQASPSDRPWRETGLDMGIASLIFGVLTFSIQLIGGLLCGWVGWALGITAIITGIMAIAKGSKWLGISGIILSAIGVIYQVLTLI